MNGVTHAIPTQAAMFGQKSPSPLTGITAIDHMTFWVSNSKYCASYFCHFFGFRLFAYKGLETGSREVCSYVVQQNDIRLVFCSPYEYGSGELWSHLSRKGDMVKDVAFRVANFDQYLDQVRSSGVPIVKDIWQEADSHGIVRMARISAFGTITHTLIDRSRYKGAFLPSYREPLEDWKIPSSPSKEVFLKTIDHFVPVLEIGQTSTAFDMYTKLGLQSFCSADDFNVSTGTSGLRMVVVSNETKDVIINLVEPRKEDKVSQLREFLQYNNGVGIQHIALRTDNMVQTISGLRDRGIEFLTIPASYYKKLRQRLESSKVIVQESIDTLEELDILLDFNDDGYILQIFTKPLFDRPTTYLEIIQRKNHTGFGAGNVQALYEAVERLQQERGNL